MPIAQYQFLELLKVGLWGKDIEFTYICDKIDWKGILRIAKEQTVSVIIADGIEFLPPELYPPKEVLIRLMMLRTKTVQAHMLLNKTLAIILQSLNENHVHAVLLKGQGTAQNYRKPESRMCGDIDLYTGPDGYNKACHIISTLDRTSEKLGLECGHHMHLTFNGVEIEVHRHAEVLPGNRANTSFQQWTKQSIDDHFGSGELLSYCIDDTIVPLPTPTFDAFYILHHAVRHMITQGVGFRQLCDWTMYIYRHHAEIDTTELQARLREFHMEDVWQEFGIIAVTILGLPLENLPLPPSEFVSKKTEKILQQVFISGNFGRYDYEQKSRYFFRSKRGYLSKKLNSFRFQISRLFKLFTLFPRYITSYMWHWLVSGSRRVFTGESR